MITIPSFNETREGIIKYLKDKGTVVLNEQIHIIRVNDYHGHKNIELKSVCAVRLNEGRLASISILLKENACYYPSIDDAIADCTSWTDDLWDSDHIWDLLYKEMATRINDGEL